jgi:molybdopterin-guanine dinucleotide biosynthesis protein A
MSILPLHKAVALDPDKVISPGSASQIPLSSDNPVLILLAAGKGTRFGTEPKCIQPVAGSPLSRHTIDSFHQVSSYPAVCVVGYRQEDVRTALGEENYYIISDNPVGGTAYAVWESFSLTDLEETDPLLVITMGDRVVPSSIFDRLLAAHCGQKQEPGVTLLTAVYEAPLNAGRGRILRDSVKHNSVNQGQVEKIVEQKDIDREQDETLRKTLQNITECNCPLYVVRARKLKQILGDLSNNNAQNQYYLTDIIEAFRNRGEEIRTVTIAPGEPAYDLLSSDVTRPDDLALLEGILSAAGGKDHILRSPVDTAAARLAEDRSIGQIRSIARQLEELHTAADTGLQPELPVSIGVSGGRLRIAFMHPDMERFYGPAWQMPVGAADEQGEEQITVIIQESGDNLLHVHPTNSMYSEQLESVPSDQDCHYPSDEIDDISAYEKFGTRLSENLLLSMGYFSDEELEARRSRKLPLPPPSRWINSNMRRPFTLIANAIASIRTLRRGTIGEKIQLCLGRGNFSGLRAAAAGNIPQGGFSSSSALTVAVKNAINMLYELHIPNDLLIHLACQAEYGTGVRAGSLDQATEQKGIYGIGTLISSNPRDNYAVLGTFPVPQERYAILYPYSVARDREAWKWSWGFYGSGRETGIPTAGEYRKMTGKAAAIAAILTDLPDETDFFKEIEQELIRTGSLTETSRAWITGILKALPLRIDRDELRQIVSRKSPDSLEAARRVENLFSSDWRNPQLPIGMQNGRLLYESGIPLRSMTAYLFAEVVRNFSLLHNSEAWIRCVTLSQRGDCCVVIDPLMLPEKDELLRRQPWEKELAGPELLAAWLQHAGAVPFDYNQGLRDEDLTTPVNFLEIQGGSFFRGLALIDLIEAMLKRAFGNAAVAVRVNAAGQGDFFQVHVDRKLADPEEVKQFISQAFYARFSLHPEREFVELQPGGGAVGARLERADLLVQVISRLRRMGQPLGIWSSLGGSVDFTRH